MRFCIHSLCKATVRRVRPKAQKYLLRGPQVNQIQIDPRPPVRRANQCETVSFDIPIGLAHHSKMSGTGLHSQISRLVRKLTEMDMHVVQCFVGDPDKASMFVQGRSIQISELIELESLNKLNISHIEQFQTQKPEPLVLRRRTYNVMTGNYEHE